MTILNSLTKLKIKLVSDVLAILTIALFLFSKIKFNNYLLNTK